MKKRPGSSEWSKGTGEASCRMQFGAARDLTVLAFSGEASGAYGALHLSIAAACEVMIGAVCHVPTESRLHVRQANRGPY